MYSLPLHWFVFSFTVVPYIAVHGLFTTGGFISLAGLFVGI